MVIAEPSTRAAAVEPHSLNHRYEAMRAHTLALTEGLSAEDQQVQSMPDVSPTKWHLAHTTWFFETFLLGPQLEGYAPFDPAFHYLFNSYYEGEGPRHPRPERGLITRPSLAQVLAYRAHVDEGMARLLASPAVERAAELVELGLNHEQQHQELILMDIKHVFWCNPLKPAYREAPAAASREPGPPHWQAFPAGLRQIGQGGEGFSFDNEGPRHRVYLEAFEIADRLVTCGEYVGFIDDGGYRRPELWLSDGWATVQAEGWKAPLYWSDGDKGRQIFTLHGERPIDPAEPVCHLSHYEADAYARWAGARLPTEAEWETAAASADHLGGGGRLHPTPDAGGEGLRQLGGQVWQWTASAYLPYPRFKPAPGAVGEYNGKFMSGQMALRGSACVTASGHTRITYRNFFPPQARWAFSGLRLARDA